MPNFFNRYILPVFLLAPMTTASLALEFDLTPRKARDQVYQVRIELKVGGDLTVRDTSSGAAEDAVQKKPMSVRGKLDYEELQLSTNQLARYYTEAAATIKVNEGGKAPTLDQDRKLVVGQTSDQQRLLLRALDGPLTREQLDLIDVIGASEAMDGLLPGKTLEEGESWQVGAEVMRSLLGLDSISVCEVANVVDEGNASSVKFQVAGAVFGKVDGADTELDVRGLGLFDRRTGCVARLNLAVKETRKPGPATPGFIGVAKTNITRAPVDQPAGLTKKRLATVAAAPAPPEDLLVESRDLGMRLLHDRRWFLANESRQSVSLRMVDENGLIAQATITHVPAKKAVNQPTLDSFESDLKSSLDESLVKLVGSEQWTSSTGCHCLGAVARTKAEDVEVEQRHYLVMPTGDGHSISIAVTLAAGDMAAVANADRLLADSLQLLSGDKTEVAQAEKESAAK